ncbi:hypothetical protein [Clostridium manihotivorum]|uniref:Uncharacterized protein n=1 Tax=Clostridium manihotivorum TaxID=2320868 RepID=A0A410DPV3_9CLOT|nr:hypothetical protein [Clostridium manihotivorum]QAA31081.1 hypothetical protein C1I91_05045 [Clostridium manihotivorum]
MNKKSIPIVMILFVIIAAIRYFPIEKIPFPVVIVILISCMLLSIFSVLRYKGSNKERVYLIVMTILVILLLCTIVMAVIIQNNYPQLSVHVKPIFVSLMAILFVTLLIVVFANALYKSNNIGNSKKK